MNSMMLEGLRSAGTYSRYSAFFSTAVEAPPRLAGSDHLGHRSHLAYRVFATRCGPGDAESQVPSRGGDPFECLCKAACQDVRKARRIDSFVPIQLEGVRPNP